VEAANWPAEQAIRPAVIFRKMSGGHRSSKGAETHDILTSVIRTCVQRTADAVAFIREAFCQQTPGILPIPPIGQSP
jgi:transposase